jgi:hypothetical protein
MDQENLEEFSNLLGANSSRYKEGSQIQTVSFATYNTPVFKENKWKNFIQCGPDNLWPQYLVRLLNGCSIHSAIIDDKVQQVNGSGIAIEDSEDKDQLAAMTDFLKRVNIKKQLKRWATDQQIFGYWFIGITWSKDRTKIANIYHVDASTIRVGCENEEGLIDHFWYSEDWSKYKRQNFKPEKIERFDPLKRIDENCLFMVRGYRPNTRFYNLPSYEAARDAIELSAALTSYLLSNLKNGLHPSLNISFNNGQATEEERETVYRSINQLFSGDKNAGRFILSFNNSKENGTEITPINQGNMSELYAKLDDYAEGKILRAHKTSPILVGIATGGKMGGAGNTNELEKASEDFHNKVVDPCQNEIEEILQDLLEVNDWHLRVYIKPCAKISSAYGDNVLLNVLTVDEIRSKMNFAPLSENDKKNLAINISENVEPVAKTVVEHSVQIPGLKPYVNELPDDEK